MTAEEIKLDAMAEDLASFRQMIRQNHTTGCWQWRGPTENGYGRFPHYVDGKRHYTRSHRYSWLVHFGEIPAGDAVLQKCKNTLCCNPEHLYLGLRARVLKTSGEHGNAKLTKSAVIEIRRRVSEGEQGKVLAKEFGVTQSRISDIHKRKTWAWVA
jgi:hypothetical protein